MNFIRRVTLRNYKSIASCKVELQRLTFLVGPNGSGKSNFLDSLRFTSDALRTSLQHALRERGTIREVRRRSGGVMFTEVGAMFTEDEATSAKDRPFPTKETLNNEAGA